jgi:pimeloyl-ACP methyl ester carboxylesterase
MILRDLQAPITQRFTTSRDGTSIAYNVVGTGPRHWLMPPAMGAPLVSMKYLLEHFSRDYTIVTWDQRGFYRSGVPRDANALRIDDHMDDLDAVLAATGIESFVLGGWSMAVQLSLECYSRRADQVRALVLISGPYEKALSSVAPIPAAESMALGALRVGARASRLLNPIGRRVLGARRMAKTLHRVGLLAENPEFFAEILAEFSHVDWGRYFVMGRHLHEHSAAHVLPRVRVPTLVVAGTHDFTTRMSVAEKMHQAIPGSELFVVPRATHYIVAEFPDLLTARIREFFARHQLLAAQ